MLWALPDPVREHVRNRCGRTTKRLARVVDRWHEQSCNEYQSQFQSLLYLLHGVQICISMSRGWHFRVCFCVVSCTCTGLLIGRPPGSLQLAHGSSRSSGGTGGLRSARALVDTRAHRLRMPQDLLHGDYLGKHPHAAATLALPVTAAAAAAVVDGHDLGAP